MGSGAPRPLEGPFNRNDFRKGRRPVRNFRLRASNAAMVRPSPPLPTVNRALTYFLLLSLSAPARQSLDTPRRLLPNLTALLGVLTMASALPHPHEALNASEPLVVANGGGGGPSAGSAFVHLFEWSWDDVAQECEQWLGPKGPSPPSTPGPGLLTKKARKDAAANRLTPDLARGFHAVQVSPAMEHIQGPAWYPVPAQNPLSNPNPNFRRRQRPHPSTASRAITANMNQTYSCHIMFNAP